MSIYSVRRLLILGIFGLLFSCTPDDSCCPPGTEFPLSEILKNEVDIPFDLNPNGITPLAALATFKTTRLCNVKLEVVGDEMFTHEFSGYSDDHEIPILGLYPGGINEVYITLTTVDGAYAKDTLNLLVPPVPADFPEITIETLVSDQIEPGFQCAELNLGTGQRYRTTPIIFDHNGVIRWWMELDFMTGIAWPIHQLKNGNLLFARNKRWFEYSMVGELINEWELNNYYVHHDILEMPDGNFLAITDKIGEEIIAGTGATVTSKADHIILIDRQNGDVLREWDVADLLDVDRYEILGTQEDWLHMNGIWYDDSDQSIVFSGRNQGVAKINWDNELQWILAPHRGWEKAGRTGEGFETSDYLLTAVDASGQPYPEDVQDGGVMHPDFNWPWAQHAPEILPNGNVMVFDNGFKRNFGSADEFSRGVEYQINEENGTVQQVWAYGEERGSDFYASIISDVDYLPNTGNRLVAPGVVRSNGNAYSKIVEIDPITGMVVYEATLNFKNAGGNGTPTWWNMDISYRAERLNLYRE